MRNRLHQYPEKTASALAEPGREFPKQEGINDIPLSLERGTGTG